MGSIWLVLAVSIPLVLFIGSTIFISFVTVNSLNIRNGIVSSDFLVYFLMVIILAIVAGIIYIIIDHKLLERNAEHGRRERMLREGIIEYITLKARERGMEQALAPQIATMNGIHAESNAEEMNQHNWLALLLLIPGVNIIIGLYILYILTQYDVKHNQRWYAFAQQTQYAGQALGMTIMFPSWKSTPQRSFVVYLIVTLLFSLFLIYWYYVLIKDMNEHYKAQWQFEDQLMSSL